MFKAFFIRLLAALTFLAILFFIGWWQKDRLIVFLDKHFYEESQQVCKYVLRQLSEDAEPIMLDGFCHIGQLALVSEAESRLEDNLKP